MNYGDMMQDIHTVTVYVDENCFPMIHPENVCDETGLDIDIVIACLNMLAAYGKINRYQYRLHIEYGVIEK